MAVDQHLALREGRVVRRRARRHGPLGLARTVADALDGDGVSRAVGPRKLDLRRQRDPRHPCERAELRTNPNTLESCILVRRQRA